MGLSNSDEIVTITREYLAGTRYCGIWSADAAVTALTHDWAEFRMDNYRYKHLQDMPAEWQVKAVFDIAFEISTPDLILITIDPEDYELFITFMDSYFPCVYHNMNMEGGGRINFVNHYWQNFEVVSK